MKLVAFRENDPYSVTEFPFDDMYETDRKFVKIGIEGDLWLGVLITNTEIEGAVTINRLSGFTSFQTNLPVTKKEVVSAIYKPDREAKILRDRLSGRNFDEFLIYDAFVQSIPSS